MPSSWPSIWAGASIFFGLHRIGLALVEIVVLWLAILATTDSVLAGRPDRRAAACCPIWPGPASPPLLNLANFGQLNP